MLTYSHIAKRGYFLFAPRSSGVFPYNLSALSIGVIIANNSCSARAFFAVLVCTNFPRR